MSDLYETEKEVYERPKRTNARHFHSEKELVEKFGRECGEGLYYINQMILDVSLLIESLQPERKNAIQLFFKQCGSNCSGCPHASWGIWRSTVGRKKGKRFLVRSRVKTPKRTLPYRNDKEGELRDAIDMAILLIERRAALIESLRAARRSVDTTYSYFEEEGE